MGIPTPHISAGLGDFAETVLMPGDPLRAEYIAKNFLENAKKVTSIRNMLGFTGTYKNKAISVMGSGMGIPSMSIYAKELYTEYDVQNIIRVGSCGAIAPELELRDVLIAMGASTDSTVNRQRLSGYDFSAICDYGLLEKAVKVARKKEKNVKVGNLFSTDLFYGPDSSIFNKMIKMGILGVEMEAAGLYGVAAECGKKAIAICTVSDHIIKEQALSAEERQTTFNDMVEISLEL